MRLGDLEGSWVVEVGAFWQQIYGIRDFSMGPIVGRPTLILKTLCHKAIVESAIFDKCQRCQWNC